MTHITYIITIIITGLVSSLITTYLPTFKRVFQRIFKRSKRKSPKYTLKDLDLRIHNIETMLSIRDRNIQQKVRREVEKQLKEIIND